MTDENYWMQKKIDLLTQISSYQARLQPTQFVKLEYEAQKCS